MFSDNKVFQIALFISIAAHGFIFFQNPNLSSFNRQQKEEKIPAEVRYLKPAKELRPMLKTTELRREPFLKLPAKITVNKTNLPPGMSKEFIPPELSFNKPAFIKPEIIAVKKKITLAPTDIDKINSPSYISHSQIVREKIKRALYQNYNRMETGQVYLSFVLSNNGNLKEVRMTEEKSTASEYLREIAVRSLRDASPFPNFPKELDYGQLSFNVIISFEIE